MVSEIVWTKQARLNLQEIKEFISKDSELYASCLINLIYSSVTKLLKFPEIGMIVPVKQPYNKKDSCKEVSSYIYCS